MSTSQQQNESVPSSEYTRDYYQTQCEGYEEFSTIRGGGMTPRLAIPIQLANIQPGMRILDIGCGRGEVVITAVRKGAFAWGIDYANEAVKIANDTVNEILSEDLKQMVMIGQSDAKSLPFPDHSMDRVFMLDVVEHLYPEELKVALLEARRILKSGGQLIIHTLPNLWYYKYGYPLYRILQRFRGKRLPANPRARYPYNHLHVNEQTPKMLRDLLRACDFDTRLWVATTQDYRYEINPVVRFGMLLLTHIYPFRWVFCDDIFAIATKHK